MEESGYMWVPRVFTDTLQQNADKEPPAFIRISKRQWHQPNSHMHMHTHMLAFTVCVVNYSIVRWNQKEQKHFRHML